MAICRLGQLSLALEGWERYRVPMITVQRLLFLIIASLLVGSTAMAQQSFYDISAKTIDGSQESMSAYKGKVLLIVNTASQCGFTPQYAGLEKLYEQYKDRGFVVLGFPSNDFGSQEPGADAEIKHFCTSKFGVSFPLYSKVQVVGAGRAPIYQFLTSSTGGAEVGWNFEKFLVDKSGHVVGRFSSNVKPSDPELTTSIEKALS